jgi:hypothetical protein
MTANSIARRWRIAGAAMAAALLLSGAAGAQTYEDDDYQSDEEARFAFAVGVGLVEPADEVENYFMAALRIRVGDEGTDDRGSNRSQGGVRGYLEPEIGYWESSDDFIEGSDLLVGINLIGSVPLGPVDSFFGAGAGVHFIDSALLEGDGSLDDSETKLGANAQFGLDLRINRSLSAFGAGRFDLVQGSEDSIQSKVYLGLRAAF